MFYTLEFAFINPAIKIITIIIIANISGNHPEKPTSPPIEIVDRKQQISITIGNCGLEAIETQTIETKISNR